VRIFFIRFVVAFAKAVVNGDGWSQRDDEQTASHPRHLILLGQTEFVIYNGEMTRIDTKPNQKVGNADSADPLPNGPRWTG
jgi:hypothetical protein